ncbi:MAG: CRISPR-associated endonuclease Cas2 [Victivallaceae bacterium]|nr:CRISPR-associated endonuclease Cas2 [Victivallaceae bacterium]
MSQEVFNAYRIMWLFVFFDLPVGSKEERRRATDFRKALLFDGFDMMQFSVYTRACPTKENAEVHVKRIKYAIPPDGKVSILAVTDKQFSMLINYWGAKPEKPPDPPEQLLLL